MILYLEISSYWTFHFFYLTKITIYINNYRKSQTNLYTFLDFFQNGFRLAKLEAYSLPLSSIASSCTKYLYRKCGLLNGLFGSAQAKQFWSISFISSEFNTSPFFQSKNNFKKFSSKKKRRKTVWVTLGSHMFDHIVFCYVTLFFAVEHLKCLEYFVLAGWSISLTQERKSNF